MRTIFEMGKSRRTGRLGAFRRGFTLIEAALTTVIIGVGVMAMLELLATGTASNVDSAQLTTATNLAKQIREITIQKTFAEILAMDGDAYNPPQDGSGLEMNTLAGWEQAVRIQPVDARRLTLNIIDDDPEAVRVTVTINHNGTKVTEASWHRFK
jgi:type II secretory pathway pseudopilin PulG